MLNLSTGNLSSGKASCRDGLVVVDSSNPGPLAGKILINCINCTIYEGEIPVLGFHDQPDEIWINSPRQVFALNCQSKGFLRI